MKLLVVPNTPIQINKPFVPQASRPMATHEKLFDLIMTRNVSFPPTEIHRAINRIHMARMEDLILNVHGVQAQKSRKTARENWFPEDGSKCSPLKSAARIMFSCIESFTIRA